MRSMSLRALRCMLVALGAFALLAVHIAPAGASTIVTPSGGVFVVPGDADGRPQSFTVEATGFAPGSSVAIEQCDGTSPDSSGWTPNEHCDTATSPASVTVGADGIARFPKDDRNFGFTPFTGLGPTKLFNCLAPGEAEPHDGVPSFTNCKVRVATSTINPTGDQAFLQIRVTALRPGASPVAPTTTTVKKKAARPASSTTATTVKRGASAGASTTPTTTKARGEAVRRGLAEAKAAGEVKTPTLSVHAGGTSPSSSRSTGGNVWHAITSVPGVILLVLVIALAVGAARRRLAHQ